MAVPSSSVTVDDDLLNRLNRLSLTRSFTPQLDIDWDATTADDEFEALYPAWSLLEGTGIAGTEAREFRVRFAKYQQMNLMIFTALLERHAISALARAYELDRSQGFVEYLGHFIKEEMYHYTMFVRAVDKIQAMVPGGRAVPTRGVDRVLRWLFRFAGLLPGRKLRSSFTFTIFRFAEQVTMYASQMAQSLIPRRASLVNQVWSFHALDEARHLAFDSMILERNRLPGMLAGMPRLLAAPWCVVLSLLLNANEIWIARQLGVPVRLWQLPLLMRRTRAPFKRRVFGLLQKTVRGDDPVDKGQAMDVTNRVSNDRTVRGEAAYVYAFKARAKRHHCLGYGTFSVNLACLETLRKQYSRAVSPITYLPIYVKATAIAIKRNPEANAILFRKLLGLRIVQFERVDVNLPITRRIGDRSLTFIGTVRNAAEKSLADIQAELTEYQRCPPEQSFAIRRIQQFAKMPLWMARLVHAWMTWSPAFYVRNVGTCGLTLVEGDGHERGFPIAPTSVVFGIGSARREPVVRGNEVVIGRELKCSLMVDNYVVSGLTGGRLIKDFKDLLESGSFISEEMEQSVRAAVEAS